MVRWSWFLSFVPLCICVACWLFRAVAWGRLGRWARAPFGTPYGTTTTSRLCRMILVSRSLPVLPGRTQRNRLLLAVGTPAQNDHIVLRGEGVQPGQGQGLHHVGPLVIMYSGRTTLPITKSLLPDTLISDTTTRGVSFVCNCPGP